jgi:hypothetical protein
MGTLSNYRYGYWLRILYLFFVADIRADILASALSESETPFDTRALTHPEVRES